MSTQLVICIWALRCLYGVVWFHLYENLQHAKLILKNILRVVVLLGRVQGKCTGKGYKGTFWGNGNVLYLVSAVFEYQTHLIKHLRICAFHCMLINLNFKKLNHSFLQKNQNNSVGLFTYLTPVSFTFQKLYRFFLDMPLKYLTICILSLWSCCDTRPFVLLPSAFVQLKWLTSNYLSPPIHFNKLWQTCPDPVIVLKIHLDRSLLFKAFLNFIFIGWKRQTVLASTLQGFSIFLFIPTGRFCSKFIPFLSSKV